MTSKKLYHFYDWDPFLDKSFFRQIREFVDNGVRDFVITDRIFNGMCEDRTRVSKLHDICKDFQVDFAVAHAPFGKFLDLNTPDETARKDLYATHSFCMETAAEFGCRTYTMHVGAWFSIEEHVPLAKLRPLALDMLEKLVPVAEKNGLVLAVENSFEIPNSAKEVRNLVDSVDSPSVGICFDTGHANCMASGAGKTLEKYSPYLLRVWWENGFCHEDNALAVLADKIVTCHLHDNSGFWDHHCMPGDGTLDWNTLVPELQALPNVIEFQTEVVPVNWPEDFPAPPGGYSIKKLVETFKNIGF